MKRTLMPALLAALASCASGQTMPKPVEPEVAPGYRIGAEDTLQIAVFGNEQLSRTVAVRPDGMISLPLINDIKAAGLTPMELREAVRKKLVEFVPSPEIAVIVTEVKSLNFSVIGQVMKPGRYDLRSAATVVDALALAGGFKEFASRNRIVVIRPEGTGKKRMAFDYDRLLSANNPQENFPLKPGDIVLVP